MTDANNLQDFQAILDAGTDWGKNIPYHPKHPIAHTGKSVRIYHRQPINAWSFNGADWTD